MRFSIGTEERWPTLVMEECGEDQGVEVPDRLAKRLADAQAALTEAEDEVARWVKYSRPEASGHVGPLIDRLPTPDERKSGRKR